MAYTIDKYNNTQLTVVEDGTIDQTTDLKLVGKNYAGYGEIQNENFVFLLENFAGANAPPKAISGQIWFDAGSSKLKFYDGSKFRTTGGAEVSASQPSGLTEGDFWWDTSNEQLYAYNGSSFVLIGPQDAGDGVTQMQSRVIKDNTGTNRQVIASIVNDVVTTVFSSIAFTIDSTEVADYQGFTDIKQGVTLKDSTSGVTSSSYRFWGTASDADKLGGVSAANYVQAGNADFSSLATFADIGIAVGDSNDLRLKIENDNQAVISNEVGTLISIRAKNNVGSLKTSFRFFADSVLPGTGETISIGSGAEPFSNIYAATFTGEATKASTVKVGSDYRSADTSAVANTVAVRDASGNLTATVFNGTATAAKYADLAEKYTTEESYPTGTVVSVSISVDSEMTLALPGSIVAGVISENPAYLMNAEAEGQAVALKGRVPVRVYGPVNKGDSVFVDQDGIASTIGNGDLVGIALETNSDQKEKLVECFLKV